MKKTTDSWHYSFNCSSFAWLIQRGRGLQLERSGSLGTDDEEEGRMTQVPKDRRSRIEVRWIRLEDIWVWNLLYHIELVNVTSSRENSKWNSKEQNEKEPLIQLKRQTIHDPLLLQSKDQTRHY